MEILNGQSDLARFGRDERQCERIEPCVAMQENLGRFLTKL